MKTYKIAGFTNLLKELPIILDKGEKVVHNTGRRIGNVFVFQTDGKEDVREVAEEPVVDDVKTSPVPTNDITSQPNEAYDFSTMTKQEIVDFVMENKGVQLDKSLNKTNLIEGALKEFNNG